MSDYILEMKNITKEFSRGVKALNNVNLRVKKGEIHALVGENGAGKSTLMNVLSGVYPYGTYTGDIIYKGEKVAFRTIKDSEHKGITIIHQELALIPYLSIRENIFLGNEIKKNGVVNHNASYKRAKDLMENVDFHDSPNLRIIDIGVGKQQLVEICKALAKNCELLILDEPTASLNDTESEKLLDLLMKFREQGMTCILISHKLKEVTRVADSITVIRDGATIETLDVRKDDITENRIVTSMVGRSMEKRFPERNHEIGDVFFEVKNWSVAHPLQPERKVCDNISISVRKGEVVGIAGLMGAGRTEFAMSVFGKSYGKYLSGEIVKDGKTVKFNTPKEAINNGVAYVTEDRKVYGLVLTNDIKDNLTLVGLDNLSKNAVMDKGKIITEAEKMCKQLVIKTPDVYETVGNLSGGNQQKVVLGKWIMVNPDILILDEPTRGIDVGAKYEIYLVINELVKSGKGVVLISSELEEVLGMSDRIYVLSEGKVKGELDGAKATQETIMKCIVRDDNAVS